MRIDGNAGTGMKPSDHFCVPLINLYHTGVLGIHKVGTKSFLDIYEIDIYRELHRLAGKYIEKSGRTRK